MTKDTILIRIKTSTYDKLEGKRKIIVKNNKRQLETFNDIIEMLMK